MAKRARVIYNPTSGREALRNDLVDILDVYEQAGYETSAFATTPEPDSAKNEAARAAKEGFDLIVAAGGDGTLSEVVNGLAGLKKRPLLAIIPAGTTNDYARALRVPRDNPVAAAKLILDPANRFKIDIGQAGDKYFMNIAAGGTLTELTYDVPSQMKSMFGYLAYFAKPEMAYTYLAEYNSGAVVPEHMKYSDSPTFAEMYEKWKKYRKSLKNKISDSHGEIMRLLFIISVNCMTANLFPSGQMICSNA